MGIKEPLHRSVPPVVEEVLHSPGEPLDPATRAFFEQRLRHDFTRVRVHADEKAAESARSLNAKAFTVGKEIVFGRGWHQPETADGRRLLAHELAHVVQQSRGGPAPELNPGMPHERDARSAAAEILADRPTVNAGNGTAAGIAREVLGEQEIKQAEEPALRSRLKQNEEEMVRQVYTADYHEALGQERTAIEKRLRELSGANDLVQDEAIDRLVEAAIGELDGRARGKVLISELTAARGRERLKMWALKLQAHRQSPYGNYLNFFFVKLMDSDAGIASELAELVVREGVAIGPASGHFQNLAYLDPSVPAPLNPQVAKVPVERFVDNFVSVQYDLNYKPIKPGRLSELLQVSYRDGTRIDLALWDISDNIDSAPANAFAQAYLGPGGRIFPSRLSRDTVPRLWQAKQKALAAMAASNEDFETFVSIGLAGVMSSLPIGPLGEPDVAPSTGGARIPRLSEGPTPEVPVETPRPALKPARALKIETPTQPASGEMPARPASSSSKAVDEYLARGGKVTEVPYNPEREPTITAQPKSEESPPEGYQDIHEQVGIENRKKLIGRSQSRSTERGIDVHQYRDPLDELSIKRLKAGDSKINRRLFPNGRPPDTAKSEVRITDPETDAVYRMDAVDDATGTIYEIKSDAPGQAELGRTKLDRLYKPLMDKIRPRAGGWKTKVITYDRKLAAQLLYGE